MTALRPQWLGRVPYREAWRLQRLRRRGVLEGTAPEAFWLLEHPPVITCGLRGVGDLPAPGLLRSAGVDLVRVERGGLATFHGPGQLVGYLVLDLGARGTRVRDFVHGIERGIAAWLGERGVSAGPRQGYPGVWVGRDKICAVGIHVHEGVTLHGFALNLTADLSGFSLITPCGITDGGVTSLHLLRDDPPPPQRAARSVGRAVLEALEPGR